MAARQPAPRAGGGAPAAKAPAAAKPGRAAQEEVVVKVEDDREMGGYGMMMPFGFYPHHRNTHRLIIIVMAFLALYLLLRWKGKELRNDWTPLGIGIKVLLVICAGALIYYPYELFFTQGPEAVQRAMHS